MNGRAAALLATPGLAPAVAKGADAVREEYARRLELRRGRATRFERFDRRLADARLIVFTCAVVLVWLSLWSGAVAKVWLVAPAVAFVSLVVGHERLRDHAKRVARSAELYERGLRRLDGTWPGTGVTGERFLDPEHPYAADLDVFGRGSLFERLCVARTSAGEAALACWLLDGASQEVVRERQEAVEELAGRLDLREDVELLGLAVRAEVGPEALADWGRAAPEFRSPSLAPAAFLLAFLATAALLAWAFTEVGRIPVLVMILIEVGLVWSLKSRVARVVGGVERHAEELRIIADLLARLEREPFSSALLVRLKGDLGCSDGLASERIGKLARLVARLEMRENQAFAPLAALWLWGVQHALAIERWRGRTGPEIGRWLEAVGRFEALSSLAAYAYENPDDVFPAVVDGPGRFEGRDLGHPLLPIATCVRNDVALGGALKVLLVSGSNMSGKSTLLRTVGVNAVLALAGAPVRAAALAVSPLSIGATLRVQDSLQAGRSRFFAEIARVRQIVDLSRGPRPLLFLLDEIFHGTNSHDRVAGAQGVVRGLVGRGAVGLVTTHDLALTAVAVSADARNVHFEDEFVDGVMHFDYRMKPGVVEHSNALALMRAVGLDISDC